MIKHILTIVLFGRPERDTQHNLSHVQKVKQDPSYSLLFFLFPQDSEHVHLLCIVHGEAYLPFPSWYVQKILLGGKNSTMDTYKITKYFRCYFEQKLYLTCHHLPRTIIFPAGFSSWNTSVFSLSITMFTIERKPYGSLIWFHCTVYKLTRNGDWSEWQRQREDTYTLGIH